MIQLGLVKSGPNKHVGRFNSATIIVMKASIKERIEQRKKRWVAETLKWQAKNKAKGLCPCGRGKPVEGLVKCQQCRNARHNWYIKNKTRVAKQHSEVYFDRRWLVIEHYGGVCVCCGQDFPPFLCLDHIKGGGRQHSKLIGRGTNYYDWIIKNDFPKDIFQILCANCNQAKGTKLSCPCQGA